MHAEGQPQLVIYFIKYTELKFTNYHFHKINLLHSFIIYKVTILEILLLILLVPHICTLVAFATYLDIIYFINLIYFIGYLSSIYLKHLITTIDLNCYFSNEL